MFTRNIGLDVSNVILILEIVWHSGIQNTPLIQVYRVLLQCFSPSTTESKPVLVPHMRDKASDAAKAFVHLFIRRQCIDDGGQELTEQLTSKSKTPWSWQVRERSGSRVYAWTRVARTQRHYPMDQIRVVLQSS